MQEKLLFLDTEFANVRNKSICQIGLLSEYFPSGEPVFPEQNIYINPEDGFQNRCVQIHEITPERVKNEPTFPVVWKKIKPYFKDSIIVGHNVVASDINALVKTCARYNIELSEIYYIDTLSIARDYVPYYDVQSFSLHSLCDYFDLCLESEHNAFDDACATADLLKIMIEEFDINIEDYIKRYYQSEVNEFVKYISDPVLRRSMTEFYGMVQGFNIDHKIVKEEFEYIKQWGKTYKHYSKNKEFVAILETIDKIVEDGIITEDEMIELQSAINVYYRTISGAPETLALQVLNGILKGIIIDNKVSTEECKNLQYWLYENSYLCGHFPYDQIISVIETVLEDGTVTKSESDSLIEIINSLLSPIEDLKQQIYSVKNKNVCLTGNFSHGSKDDISSLIISQGGYIDKSVKKTTNILIIGSLGSEAYSQGTYGTKVEKAIYFNNRGNNIAIIKEDDYFANIVQKVKL